MKYYYDIEREGYISESKLKRIYDELKSENPEEICYPYPHFVSNCMTINNGSLETMETRKAYLNRLLLTYEPDDVVEIKSIKSEIAFVESLVGGAAK